MLKLNTKQLLTIASVSPISLVKWLFFHLLLFLENGDWLPAFSYNGVDAVDLLRVLFIFIHNTELYFCKF